MISCIVLIGYVYCDAAITVSSSDVLSFAGELSAALVLTLYQNIFFRH